MEGCKKELQIMEGCINELQITEQKEAISGMTVKHMMYKR